MTDGGCAARETLCGDGRDDDCDNQVDCADSDCLGQACDDRNLCTTGETCQANACGGGTMKTCTTPPDNCHVNTGSCVAATGECTYPARADGAACGPNPAQRCCGGACKDISSAATDCGGCGLACASGQTCKSVANDTGCGLPANTSGRCTCGTGAACPMAQTCSPIGTCRPNGPTTCAQGQLVADAGATCLPYCRY